MNIFFIFFFISILRTILSQQNWGSCPTTERNNIQNYNSRFRKYPSSPYNHQTPRSNSIIGFSQQKTWKVDCKKRILPLNWEINPDPQILNNSSNYVYSFAKRITATNLNETRVNSKVLWLIDGGPGSDGQHFSSLFQLFVKYTDQEYDVIILSHRGTGLSSPSPSIKSKFECIPSVDSPKERIISCIKNQTEIYNQFSVTNAAKDLNNWIEKEGYQTNGIIGFSYGTYLLRRYLQLFPNSVNWSIADGIVTTKQDFLDWSSIYLQGAENLIQLCEKDYNCSSIWNQFGGLRSAINNYWKIKNPCTEKIQNWDLFKNEFSSLLSILGDFRKLVLPTIFRLHRCGEKDQIWLQNLETKWKVNLGLKQTQSNPDPSFSPNVYWSIWSSLAIAKEQSTNSSFQKQIQQCKDNWICVSSDQGNYKSIIQQLNSYSSPEPGFNKIVNLTQISQTFGFNGNLDYQTPLQTAKHWENDFNHSKSIFFEVPGGEHGVILNLWNPYQNYRPIGFEILRELVRFTNSSNFNYTNLNHKVQTLIQENINYNFNFEKIFENDQIIITNNNPQDLYPLFDQHYNPKKDHVISSSITFKLNLFLVLLFLIILQ